MSFHVGQKVVCVDDNWHPEHTRSFARPVAGAKYIIREILEWTPGETQVRLVECRNPAKHWDDGTFSEVAFLAIRFRPLIERKTDISIFTEMLTPNRAPERVT